MSTLPSEYDVSSRCAASSTASEIAIPRLPGVSGNSSRIARPLCVSLDGLATISAPQSWIIERRNGFCSYEIANHVDLALEADQLARERERAPPLAGAGLGREPRPALLLVVERLRHGGVRLVAAGRADALVLVEDARLRPHGLFEPARPVERRRTPEAVHVEDLLRDRDLRLLADLLQDQRHREERREVVRPDRLAGARMQHGLRRVRHVGDDVVPTPGELRLLEQELRLLHAARITRQSSARSSADRHSARLAATPSRSAAGS